MRTSIASVVALALSLAVAAAIAWTASRAELAIGTLPAALAAICCAQLSFAPLVLGALAGHARGRPARLSGGWAMTILAVGAISAVTAVVAYITTGLDAWLWAAVPLNLATGSLSYAIAPASSSRTG